MKITKRKISLPHFYKSKHPVQMQLLAKAANKIIAAEKSGYKIITYYFQSATYQRVNAKDGGATFARLLWIAKQLVCAPYAMGNVVSTTSKLKLYAPTVPRNSCLALSLSLPWHYHSHCIGIPRNCICFKFPVFSFC